MRQKNEKDFITALNNLAIGEMNADDVNLINSRVVNETDVPVDTIRLFPTNQQVNDYNGQRIKSHKGTEWKSLAIDKIVGKISNRVRDSALVSLQNKKVHQTYGLPSLLRLKVGLRYMITSNIDVEDGLVNGACAVLRYVQCVKEKPHVLFLDFQSKSIGQKARNAFKQDQHQSNMIFDNGWVPIKMLSKEISTAQSNKYQCFRQQFPLVPAEAITIHKSQGQTYESVCVCLDNKKKGQKRHGITRTMLYVALSRVTKLSNLYIIGNFIPPTKSTKNDPTSDEIENLKTNKTLRLCYDTLENKCGLVVGYHNVRSFFKYKKHIENDPWYNHCDILVLSETQCLETDKIELNGFKIFFRSDEKDIRRQRGVIAFYKTNSIPKILKHTKIFDNEVGKSYYLDLILFEIDNVYVITGYKSPKTPTSILQKHITELFNIISTSNEPDFKLIVIGDFNFDILQHNFFFLSNYGLSSRLPVDAVTTINNTQIDVVLTNFVNVIAGTYASYFSDHSPIYCSIVEVLDNIEDEFQREMINDNYERVCKTDLNYNLANVFENEEETANKSTQ